MKILLVTALVAGGVGGHVRMLARGLVARGHHVVVACPAQVAEHFDLAATGARLLAVETGSRARPGQDLLALRALRTAAAGADAVHAHGLRAGALAALALRGRPTRLVVTSHNAPPSGAAARRIYALLERVVCARADLVLGVSPDLVERARALGAAAGGAVVPAAAAPAAAGRAPGGPRPADRAVVRAEVRRDLHLDGDRPLVLSVGRLGDQKRMEAVVGAAHELARRAPLRGAGQGLGGADPGLTLLLAGEGPDRPRLLELAESGPADVRLLGHRRDVSRLLVAADVVVSAARWEGQPLWLQEALAAGAPVVATDVGGTALVVGEAAVLVDGGDDGLPTRLADALAPLLADPARRTQLSAAAVARAAELPTEGDAVTAALTAYQPSSTGPHARAGEG